MIISSLLPVFEVTLSLITFVSLRVRV